MFSCIKKKILKKAIAAVLILMLILTIQPLQQKVIASVGSRDSQVTMKVAENENTVDSVIVGNIRVQILSPTLVRIEQKGPRGFEDRKTFFVINRNWPGAHYTHSQIDNYDVIQTSDYIVKVPSNAKDLNGISITKLDGTPMWTYKGLPGNRVLLPNISDKPLAWAIADTPRIVPASWGYNPAPEGSENYNTNGWDLSNDSPDMYVFLPKGDVKQLRKDFLDLTGHTDMVPLYALGYWDSRWYDYNETTALKQIDDYRSRNFPIDVLVIDTGWRVSASTGYGINTNLFPDMARFLNSAHAKNVRVMFNDHPEPKAGGLDPIEVNYRNNGLRSLFDKGLDIWWYDRNWSVALKPPTGIAKEVWGEYLYQWITQDYYPNRRPLIMANADWIVNGPISDVPTINSHRFSIQWTGDINPSLESLQQEIEDAVYSGIYAMFPYLSADIGGHTSNPTPDDYIRWMEYGSLSPIIRPHCTHNLARMPWTFGQTAEEISRKFINMRYRLLPYLYNLARINYDNGDPMLRRLDFYYPQYEEAKDNTQYLLGDNILVAPVSQSTANRNVWIPEGKWIDAWNGNIITGPQTINVNVPLDKTPIYIKPGSIIPLAPEMLYTSEKPWDPITLDVYPSTNNVATGRLYEDDTISNKYKTGSYRTTKMNASVNNTEKKVTVTINPSEGSFTDSLSERSWVIRVHKPVGWDIASVYKVTVDGMPSNYSIKSKSLSAMPFENNGGSPDGNVVEITIPKDSVNKARNVEIFYSVEEPVPASIKLDTSNMTLAVGDKKVVNAAILDKNNNQIDSIEAQWSSEDPAIAEVKASGNIATVTGISSGNTVIKAVYKDLYATMNVKVKDIVNVKPITVYTEVSKAPNLPTQVPVIYSDGSETLKNVVWDSIDPTSYSKVGSFTVSGTIHGSSVKTRADILVAAPLIKLEAEDAELSGGANVQRDHKDYSGSGFVAGYEATGATTTFTTNILSEGNYMINLRYANALAGDNQSITRTLSMYINDKKYKQISLPPLGNTSQDWDKWSDVSEIVHLEKGENKIAYKYDASDSGHVNLDYISTASLEGVPKAITDYEDIKVDTNTGEAPILPNLIKVRYSDNTTETLNIKWDDIDKSLYQVPGVFTVNGLIGDTAVKVTAVVTVKDISHIPTSINVDPEDMALNIGDTKQVTATVYDQNNNPISGINVNWTSDNPDVATVDNAGKITGVSAGTTIVKATYGDLSASVNVTVKGETNNTEATLEGQNSIKIGNTYTLTYGLKNAKDISAQVITLKYDPNIFDYVKANSISDGTTITATYESQPGTITFVLATTDKGKAINGNKEVLNITLKAKTLAQGTKITLTKGEISNTEGNIMDLKPIEKTINVVAKIDKTYLEKAIKEAKDFDAAIKEGINNGQYPEGTKSQLEEAIKEAQSVYDNKNVDQTTIDKATDALNNTVKEIKGWVITDTTGIVKEGETEISIGDLGMVATYFAATSNSEDWNKIKNADINHNNKIDLYDITFIARRIIMNMFKK